MMYDFILALRFWQWVGVLLLFGGACNCVVGVARAICHRKDQP